MILLIFILIIIIMASVYLVFFMQKDMLTSNQLTNKLLEPYFDSNKQEIVWTYIEFGSYPQDEVMGEELTSEIINASYDSMGDTIVDGVKYRRIQKSDAVYAGFSEYDYNWTIGGDEEGYHYFKYEPIKWAVLKKGKKNMLLIAEKGLDAQQYNSENLNIFWEESTMRSWLNGYLSPQNKEKKDFYNTRSFMYTAFTQEEKAVLVANSVDSDESVKDKIFLPSLEEVSSREVVMSDYSYAMGKSYEDSKWWFYSSMNAGCVELRTIYEGEDIVSVDSVYAVCPVIQIPMESSYWSFAQNDDRNENTPTPTENAIEQKSNWDYVYFGNYPQCEVIGEDLTDNIINASYDENGDAIVNNKKYRRITQYDATTYLEPEDGHVDGGYYDWQKGGDSNGYHYFQYEPIRWRILSDENDDLLLLTDIGLDCQKYHTLATMITWEDSDIRSWLNGYNGSKNKEREDFLNRRNFIDTAFSEEEKNDLMTSDISNNQHPNPYYHTEGGNDTRDKIFLLSFEEVTNIKYGFDNGYSNGFAGRKLKVSDYGKAMGSVEFGTTSWWLRSPGGDTGYAALIDVEGNISEMGTYTYSNETVCPVIRISVYSKLYTKDNEISE